MTATDEDTELRDLLVQTLDRNGTLGKIKAELRASIFLALETQDRQENPSKLTNQKLQKFLTDPDNTMCVEIIREFLTYFNLDYTNAVFGPEVNANSAPCSRMQLCQKLGMEASETTPLPLLAFLIKSRTSVRFDFNRLHDAKLQQAEELFQKHTSESGSDAISTQSAVDLLSTINPKFSSRLLQQYVSAETEMLSEVSWSKFLELFENLFNACHSVVSEPPAKDQDGHLESQLNAALNNSQSDFSQGDPRNVSSQGIPDTFLKPSESSDQQMDLGGSGFESSGYPNAADQSATKASRNMAWLTDPDPEPQIEDYIKPAGNDDSLFSSGKRDGDYDDDFISASHASITEDIQGDGLLSTQSSVAELTEDRTFNDKDNDVDYMEDI